MHSYYVALSNVTNVVKSGSYPFVFLLPFRRRMLHLLSFPFQSLLSTNSSTPESALLSSTSNSGRKMAAGDIIINNHDVLKRVVLVCD